MSENAAVAARRAARAAKVAERAENVERVKLEANGLFRQLDYESAANYYIGAINMNGAATPVLLSNLSAAYLKLELYTEAEWAATTALEYNPRMVKARYRRAVARKEILSFKAAKSDLEEILSLDPDNEDAKKELGVVDHLMQTAEGVDDEEIDLHPRYDEEPWDLYYDSDSEDCNYLGNGTTCRYYNHSGCARGDQCRFSHAPDDKSVRDELGKNVCADFLFGDCTFGANKCIYSHSREHLPENGWWNNPEKVAASKQVLPLVQRSYISYVELHDALVHNPNARPFATRAECKAVLEYIEWQDTNAMEDLHSPGVNNVPPTTTKPFVLVLAFEYNDMFTSGLHFSSALAKKTTVVNIRPIKGAIDQALRYLDSPHLTAVFISDAGITKKKFAKVVPKLIAYAKNGGTVAIGDQFSSHVLSNDFDSFMKKWGLDWKWGSYFRTTFYLNPSNEIVQRNPSLPKSYSMKTAHIANITPDMALYSQNEDSILESMVFDPVKVNQISKNESPAVCARVGCGLLSFIGDVNGETQSTSVVLAMLGLLDNPHPKTQPQASSSSHPRASTSAQPQTSKSAQSQPSTSAQASSSTHPTPAAPGWDLNMMERVLSNPEASLQGGYQGPARTKIFNPGGASQTATQDTTPAPAKITDKFVIILELDGRSRFRQTFAKQISALESKIEVQFVTDPEKFIGLWTSPKLHGIYVVDEGIAEPENLAVLRTLTLYLRSKGDLLVFGGALPLDADSEQMQYIFSQFDLPWHMGSYCKSEAQLNRHHATAVTNPTLCDAFHMKAVHIRDFHAEDMFYEQYFTEYDTNPNFEPPNHGEWEAPVVRTRVGKGHLGYIGDVTPEPETSDILLSMLDLLTPPKELVPDSSKFLIILSGYDELTLQQFIPEFMKDVKSKVEVHIGIGGLSKARVVDLLPSRDLVGVLVTDTDILYPQNAYLLSKLVEYSKNGGTIVFGWRFCKLVTLTQFRPLFRENWTLNWDMVGIHPDTLAYKRNRENEMFEGKNADALPKGVKINGIQIKGIEKSMAVYSPNRKDLWNPEGGVIKSSILFTRVDNGHLGYVGSAAMDGDVRSIIYSMFGLL